MALVLNEKYRGPGSYLLFITQRFFRLFPTYWLLLACIVVVELFIAAATGNHHESVPPAEPEAWGCEPLKAVVLCWEPPKGGPYSLNILSCSTRLSSACCSRI